MSRIGSKLRELRKKRGISQEDLAKVLGVTKSTISKYELGQREPDINAILKISEQFGASVEYLLGVVDEDGLLTPEGFADPDDYEIIKQLGLDDPKNRKKTGPASVPPDMRGKTETFLTINPFPAEIKAFHQFIRLFGYEITSEENRLYLNYHKEKAEVPLDELTRLLRASEATVGALVHDLFTRFKDKTSQ